MAVACKQCHWCAKHIGSLNLFGNGLLLVIKLLGGIYGQSQAMIADAVHSIADILVAVLQIVSLKISAVPPDDNHQWGHGNVEYIASTIIGILLICFAITIAITALSSIVEGDMEEPDILAVWAAFISVVLNEIMFRHGICIGERMDSPVTKAAAWENRSDCLTSIAAMIGVFGAKMGFRFLDPIAAIFVGSAIARFGLKTLLEGIKGISDRSFNKETLAGVKRLVLKEKGIRNIGRLRARQIGQKNWIDLEATFDPAMKVSDVKSIIGGLRKNIMDRFDGVADVVIVSRASEPELKEI